MEYRGRRHERGSNWTDPEIVELLQLWSDETVQLELESSLRNQRVFDRIANVLREKGIYRTGDQCREKIKKMKLEYRRIKDNHKMRSWKFYDVMDRVLANRPALTYSSAPVVAQQVFHSPSAPESYLPGVSTSAFGPVSSGGFLFGHPSGTGDLLDVKSEDVEEEMLSSGAGPQTMYCVSGDDQETDVQSAAGRGEGSTNTRTSPSGFSSTPTAPAAARQRKRRRAGRGARARGEGQAGVLDKALVGFLSWQRSAEERLLSLEEARLEREARAEERREQQEERRAEQERQHELRLLSVLAGALAAGPSTAAMTASAPSASTAVPRPLAAAATTPGSTTPPRPAASGSASRIVLATLRGPDTPGHSAYLSNRGNSIRQHQGILQEGYVLYNADKHHDTDNPSGILNMGTSENKLCFDLLRKRLSRSDMWHVDSALLQYPDWKGHGFLRREVASFLSHFCGCRSPLKADNVVVMNGCGSLFSAIAAVLCDPEDAILIPTPFYGVITEDVHLYSGVKLFHVALDCQVNGEGSQPFHLTVAKLEGALKRAKQEGVKLRAIILVNPHNPLARVYTLAEMTGFLEFAKRHELHAIVDEVYMLSVFEESDTLHSVLGIDGLPDPKRTHVMWGMSKDFAMGGIRIGTLYTENRELVEALNQLASLHGVPGTTQHQVSRLLQDREWISKEFLPENRRRLRAAHSYVTGELQHLGIPYLHWPAAFYVWADLRKYLAESSFAEELSLWRRFLRHKVVLSCGQAFWCSTPGWFRIVFSDRRHHLELGMARIRQALKEAKEINATAASGLIKEVGEEAERSAEKQHSSDNVVIDNSTSSPGNKEDSPAPEATPLASEEFVLLDCQTSKPTESLDSLIGTLKQQIHSSDWLKKNTPELSPMEDPEVLDVFRDLLQRARK